MYLYKHQLIDDGAPSQRILSNVNGVSEMWRHKNIIEISYEVLIFFNALPIYLYMNSSFIV